jgi:hypothetical protein
MDVRQKATASTHVSMYVCLLYACLLYVQRSHTHVPHVCTAPMCPPRPPSVPPGMLATPWCCAPPFLIFISIFISFHASPAARDVDHTLVLCTPFLISISISISFHASPAAGDVGHTLVLCTHGDERVHTGTQVLTALRHRLHTQPN